MDTQVHDALLKAIRVNPQANLPWLVMADFLEESGQPEVAEYIRLSAEHESHVHMGAEGVKIALADRIVRRPESDRIDIDEAMWFYDCCKYVGEIARRRLDLWESHAKSYFQSRKNSLFKRVLREGGL